MRNIRWTVAALVASVIAFTMLFDMLTSGRINALLAVALLACGIWQGVDAVKGLFVIDKVVGEARAELTAEENKALY